MRTFVGLVGGLFIVLGLLGLAGGVILVLDTSYDNPDYTCLSTAGGSSVDCTTYEDSDIGNQTYGLGALVLGGSLLVGGCALIGGAVAGSGRTPRQPSYPPQPVPSGGPPTYGS